MIAAEFSPAAAKTLSGGTVLNATLLCGRLIHVQNTLNLVCGGGKSGDTVILGDW